MSLVLAAEPATGRPDAGVGRPVDVVAGTVDGGRNMAHDNNPLPNCLGIHCW